MINGSNNPFSCTPVLVGNNNKIISLGTITRAGNVFTFSVGFVWQINGVTYQNTIPFTITIAAATTGFKRIDNAILNTSNAIELQQGLESDSGVAQQPVTPQNTIALTSWDVNGTSVNDNETPITGDAFIKKSYSQPLYYSDTGADVIIPLPPTGNDKFIFVSNSLVSISGFNLSLITGNPSAEIPFNGKEIIVLNGTANPITINHNAVADIPYIIKDEADLVVPSGEHVRFMYNDGKMKELFRSWGEFLPTDINDYDPATTPLDPLDKAIVFQSGIPKEVAVSEFKEVIEGYFDGINFYTDALFTNLITPESSKIYVALDTNLQYRWSGSAYVQIGGEFDTTINAKVLDTTEKVGLKLQNLLDEDFRRALVIQGGLTANQRRYFEYLNHLGVRTNLLGFNAQNGFIAFDSVNSYHYITCNSAGASSINSYGTFQVRVNADEGATGNNGMAIYDGTANPATSNIMYNLSSAGIYLNKGRILQAQSPDNLQFNKFFCTNGSAYINSTLALRLYNTGNKFNFADSGLVDRFVIDVASSKVKVGIGTATPDANSIVDVVSTTQFSRPFPVMTEAQRLAIVSPQIGGHVYQSNGTEGVYVYKSSGWVFAY